MLFDRSASRSVTPQARETHPLQVAGNGLQTRLVNFPNLNDREPLESMSEAVASGDQTLAAKWGHGLLAPKIRSREGA